MKVDAAAIKKVIQERKTVIGREQVLRHLKRGKLESIYLTSNIDEHTKSMVEKYCSLSNVGVIHIPFNNQELGTLCKKPFPVSILGVVKS